MLPISKFTIGVKVGRLMARVASQWGEVLDAFADLSDEKAEFTVPLAATPFDARYKATLPGERLTLVLSASDVVVITDSYTLDRNVHPDKFLQRFADVWSAANRILEIHSVRRIGMVAEYRGQHADPSRHLLSAATKVQLEDIAAKFHLAFERRVPPQDGSRPDPKSSDFINYIYGIYDSVRDEVPDETAFNANLDVQRYFSPLLEGNVPDEVKILYRKHFESEWREFQGMLKANGIVA